MNRILFGFPILAVFTMVSSSCSLTGTSYESSDGRWGDNEVPHAGRDFSSMVYFFEKYKLISGNGDTHLVRTENRPPFSDDSSPKWKVPYQPPSAHINGGYYIDPELKDSLFMNLSKSQEAIVERRSKSYMKKLDNASND